MQSIDSLDTVEKIQANTGTPLSNGQQSGGNRRVSNDTLRDPDFCVVASGLSVTDDKTLMEEAETLICALGEEVSSNVLITGATRLPTGLDNKPISLKIGFRTLIRKYYFCAESGQSKIHRITNKRM